MWITLHNNAIINFNKLNNLDAKENRNSYINSNIDQSEKTIISIINKLRWIKKTNGNKLNNLIN